MLAKMFALVADKFQDKVDKGGMPYFLHCIYVMQHCGLDDETSLCIALGHDLIEDTDLTAEQISSMFNDQIASGILALTKDKSISYEDYIKSITNNITVTKIKLADLGHNMNVSRLKRPLSKADFDRLEQYQRGMAYLKKTI